jgi:flagellar biosynthesis protein FliQ
MRDPTLTDVVIAVMFNLARLTIYGKTLIKNVTMTFIERIVAILLVLTYFS